LELCFFGLIILIGSGISSSRQKRVAALLDGITLLGHQIIEWDGGANLGQESWVGFPLFGCADG
jgi:hypothetical protein